MNNFFRGMLGLVLVALSLVSWYTTGQGMHNWMPWFGYIVAAAIQTIIAYCALNLLPGSTKLRVWPLVALIYLVGAYISVTFASAYYFKNFSSGQYAKDEFSNSLQHAYREATLLDTKFSKLFLRYQELSDFSEQMMDFEAPQDRSNYRGTCYSSKGWGPGPAYEKRRYQRSVFATMADDIRPQKELITDLLAQLETFQSPSDEFSIVKRGEHLKRLLTTLEATFSEAADVDTRQKQILARHKKWEFEGFPSSPEFTGFESYVCRDPNTAAKIESVLNTQIPDSPTFDLHIVDPENLGAIVELAFDELGDYVLGGFASEDAEKTSIVSTYTTPFRMGIMVDFFILFVGLLIQLQTGAKYHSFMPRKYSIDSLARVYRALHSLPERFASAVYIDPGSSRYRKTTIQYAVERVTTILGTFTLNIKGDFYLFLPLEQPGGGARMSDNAQRLTEAITAVQFTLDRFGFIGEPLRSERTEFEGYTLENLADKVGMEHSQFSPGGLFKVFFIHKDLFTMLDSFRGNINTFAEAGQDEIWYQFLPHRTAPKYGEVMVLLASEEESEFAEYILSKCSPPFGPDTRAELILDDRCALEKDILTWSRDNRGFSTTVLERRRVRILGFTFFPHIHRLEINEQGYRFLQDLAETSNRRAANTGNSEQP